MNSGGRLLVKVLVFVVSYVVAFALAFFALSQFSGEGTSTFAWVIIIILAICGYRAIRHLPSLFFSGGASGEGCFLTILFFGLKILLSVFAGVFIAPWMIAKKLVSLVPGGAEEAGGAAEEEEE